MGNCIDSEKNSIWVTGGEEGRWVRWEGRELTYVKLCEINLTNIYTGATLHKSPRGCLLFYFKGISSPIEVVFISVEDAEKEQRRFIKEWNLRSPYKVRLIVNPQNQDEN